MFIDNRNIHILICSSYTYGYILDKYMFYKTF